MNSTLTGPVAIYLAHVRAELSDLPPGELEDVLDDVTGHLTEVAAEFEDEPTAEALQERLGTPGQYADELRTAAGYPPRARSAEDRTRGRSALRWGFIAATVGPFFVVVGVFSWSSDAALFFGFIGLAVLFGAAYLGVRALRGNDPQVVLETPRGEQAAASIRGMIEQIPPNVRRELVTIGQPVWWVARGVVAGGGFFAVFGAGAVTVVGALAGAAVSIWIGRRTQQDRRWLWYVVPLNVIAAIIVPAWLASSFVGGGGILSLKYYNEYRGSVPPDHTYSSNGLSLDGTPISNIYPFDDQGRQVKVRLYDSDGNPIKLPIQDCAALHGQTHTVIESNSFPLPTVVQPEDGSVVDETNCKDTDKAPFVPPPAPATSTPTPSAGTTPTPTPGTGSKPTTTPRPGVTLTVSPTR